VVLPPPISSLGEVGVDIETIRQRNYLKIVKRFFHKDENEQLLNCDGVQQEQLFYRMWTLKEAFFKATGLGISQGLNKACFYLDDNNIAVQFSNALPVEKNHWQFHQKMVAPTTIAAIAINSASTVEPHWFDGARLLSDN